MKTASTTALESSLLFSSPNEKFLALMRSTLRLVKLFSGGQTVTLGKSRFEMDTVSMVVVTGLLDQLEKDWWIKMPAPENPEKTIKIQTSLTRRVLFEMCTSPCIVDDSKNSLKPAILLNTRVYLAFI